MPSPAHVLATDLDGTLIPLEGNQRNREDLRFLAEEVRRDDLTLVFVTGRHLESILHAIQANGLPVPEWIISDVGTSLWRREAESRYAPVEAYADHQDEIIASMPRAELQERLASIDGLWLQEEEKQGRFKLSYYVDATQVEELATRVQQVLDKDEAPYSIIHSVDPFNGDGLIDLLPAGVSKAHALAWWVEHAGLSPESVVFAGDSGNDWAALTAGYRAIVVGNADRTLARKVWGKHRQKGWQNRLYLAQQEATSGVLEGCRWFGLVAPLDSTNTPLGATPVAWDKTRFKVWAPRRQSVEAKVRVDGKTHSFALQREEYGYFTGEAEGVGPGTRYAYLLDGHIERPDPVSRYQPDGVHKPSQVIAPAAFPWTDGEWRGVAKRELVIYELHVGAFTEEGTFRAAIERIPELVELGVTAIELMPVAQAPGKWNWGYDGVGLYAVSNNYGEPDDLRALVDACHARGIAVLLDVVYNHLGPEGNYLADFGPYFSRKHHTPWGPALNFDARHAKHVRRFVIENALHWLREYHLDGLRLDAVHFMLDDSRPTILDDIRLAITDYAAAAVRSIHLIAEANVYDHDLLRPDETRAAYDASWCDCLMHAIYSHALPDLRVAHRDYRGADDVADALRWGYLYAGPRHERVTDEGRAAYHPGGSGESPMGSFVVALQTHDSVGNHPHGKRVHQLTSKAFQRAAASLVLLNPGIPLIFMGEEYASDSPFPFFADFEDAGLRNAVDRGRKREYPRHAWEGAVAPSNREAFMRTKHHAAEGRDSEMFAWYRSLIALRKQGVAEGWLSADRMTVDYLPEESLFRLRYDHGDGQATVILCRLLPVESPQREPIEWRLEGEVLMSSEPVEIVGEGRVWLRADQAVICRS